MAIANRAIYQEIVDNAQAATGVRLCHFAWLDAATGIIHAGASSDLDIPVMRQALAAVRKFDADFEVDAVAFPIDVNPLNARVYREGVALEGPFEEFASGTTHGLAIQVARRIAGLRRTFSCPLIAGGTVVGSLAFHTPEPLSAQARRTCQAFARQASLTLENARLADEARRAREELEAAMAAMAESARLDGAIKTARLVAHELRNDLTYVLGYAEVLSEQAEGAAAAQAARVLKGAQNAAAKLERLHQIIRFEEAEFGGQVMLDIEAATRKG